jgi:hypothetical protein
MLASLRFSRIVLVAAILAALTYLATFVLWFSAGATLSITVRATLELATQRPGLWGLGYILQAFAFILWILVPFSISQKYRAAAPGISQLAVIMGGFGFAWRALTDFARAGSIEYLGQLYASSDPAMRIMAEQMASWTQLWTFGAVWEFMGNAPWAGYWPCSAGWPGFHLSVGRCITWLAFAPASTLFLSPAS